jgi:hypothetical protein
VKEDADGVVVNGKRIHVYAIKDPAEIDWSKFGVQMWSNPPGDSRMPRTPEAPSRYSQEGNHLGARQE